jgi:hypothetical protein
VEKEVEQKVARSDLAAGKIDDTAARIVNSLFAEESDPEVVPPPTKRGAPVEAEPEPEIAPVQRETPTDRGRLLWGRYKPRPKWKWAMFGVSVGLMTLAGTALLVTGIPVAQSNKRKGFLYKKVEDKAFASLEDDNPNNDVDPDTVASLCEGEGSGTDIFGPAPGEENLPPDQHTGVRNAEVARQCNVGKAWAQATTISAIALGVTAASTIVFTTLLFVHREKPGASALLRREFRLGAAPAREGRGLTFGAGMRF